MSLTTLPLLPLEKIASYLDFSSLVSLAASTSALAHLQPTEQLVKGQDFSLLCSNMSMGMAVRYIRLNGKTPCHAPADSEYAEYGTKESPAEDHYFDVEVKTRGLLGVKLAWEWAVKVRRGNDKLSLIG